MIKNHFKAAALRTALLCVAGAISSATMAQRVVRLAGQVIGTTYSVNYEGGGQSTTVNTKDAAFDSDFNTFFASYDRSNTWVGLDLGKRYVITRVGWSPRKSDAGQQRTQLGLFEGANEPDFRDALPLYLIPNASEMGKMHYAQVNVSRGFRYVRYVGPSDSRCNIAELAFYGFEGDGDDSQYYQITNIPTLSIHTYKGQDPERKGEDFESNMCLIYDRGTLLQEYPILTRVRGNASASFAKKPYRIKFNDGKSHHMMKGGTQESPAKAKKWTLLSNYGDKTLMRNLFAFELARRFEAIYPVWGVPVDVIMNGEYHGCYQLCDQITIDPLRVPITEMEPTDLDDPMVRGGYIVEVDAYAGGEPPQSRFYTNRGMPVTIKEPGEDDIKPAQYNYIKDHFNQMEGLLFSNKWTDTIQGYRTLLDVPSFLRHFLQGELSGNTDTYYSTYMFKDRWDDHFYVCPGWDFDLAFENDTRTYPICNRSNWVYASGGSSASGMTTFVTRVLNDPLTQRELRLMWKKYRDSGAISVDTLLAYVDSMATALEASQQLTFKRWPIFDYNVHQNHSFPGHYQGEVDIVRKYITQRVPWIDNKLMYVEGDLDDGYGQTFDIATAAELIDFVKKVNNGMVRADARLTADLNLLAYRSRLTPIGSSTLPYRGHFDGQGHVLSNVGSMIFGATDGATIENLGILTGTVVQNLNYSEHTGTLIGSCVGNNPTTISNCYSTANLSSANGHAGGLVGSLYGTMSNCYYAGLVRVSSLAGGLIGSSAAPDKPANIDHCYVVSTQIRTAEGQSTGALAGRLHQGSQLFRCYSLNTLGNQVGDKQGSTLLCVSRSKEQFASGNVCWLLNDESATAPDWYQALGKDSYPTLDSARGVVSYKNSTYSNLPGTSVDLPLSQSNLLVDVYTLGGQLIRSSVPAHQAMEGLPHGIYVVNGQKVSR